MRAAAIGDAGATSAAPRLELRGVTSTYREGRARLTALSDLSLAVADREFVALVGRSGSGKSTLLDIAAGLIEPDAGAVLLDGVRLPASARLGRSAYMRQRDLLLPWRTVVGNAGLALEIAGLPRQEAEARARARLGEFGLEGRGDAFPAQLSGGMRQRVAFLRTILAGHPRLLLDEPFAALDALTRTELHDWLLALWEREGQAVLLVTHDVEEAVMLADRAVVLSAAPGRVAHVEEIDLRRPRRRSLVTDPAFVRHKAALLDALGLLDREDRA
ncbi:MAG: ABC transporter ATP-binding protein [Chloroflexia bacterium]|nr:ABC transporter ATP-binding protein [Chloroflexia bacterium]